MDFSEYLRKCRKNKKMTIKQTAEAAGISASYHSSLENGRRIAPPFEVLEQLSDALGLSAEERYRLYDLAAESKQPPALADDINAYIYEMPVLRDLLRSAVAYRLTEQDWEAIDAYIRKNFFC